MKKFLAGVLAIMSLSTASVFAESDITITIDGKDLDVKGQEAVIVEDTVMVPFREIFEGLDAYIEWIPATKSIIVAKGLTITKMQIDSDKIFVNNEEKTIPVSPKLINGTTMVPVRAVSEMLGSDVSWEASTKTVSIVVPKTATDHKSSTEYLTNEYKNDSGELLLSATVAYPIFEGEEEGISKINDLYKRHAEEFSNESITQFKEFADSKYETVKNEGAVFEPTIMLYGYEIAFDKFGLLSLVEQAEIVDNTVFYFDSVTFNPKTADIMKKEDFINFSEEEKKTMEPYSFYLYQDQVILCLNSNNIYLNQYSDYPALLAVPVEKLKYDLTTGKQKEPTAAKDTIGLENPRVEYKYIHELNSVLGFKMVELKDQIKNVPETFASIGKNIGEFTYNRDGGNVKVTLRKSPGDSDISGILGAEKTKEKLYKNSMIEYYKTDSSIYATFSIETKDSIYSYSIAFDNTSDLYGLQLLCEEVITSESK